MPWPWVLVSSYAVSRSRLAEIVEGLLSTQQVRVEATELVWRATRRFLDTKADFSDAVIAECALAVGCGKTVTFDRVAASIADMELLPLATRGKSA